MQTILAIEASTQQCSIALLHQNTPSSHAFGASQQHSTLLLPAIQAMLQKASASRVDLIAVSIGPGAFTSVRMAVGTAQGLALGWGCPVMPVDSLATMAYAAKDQCTADRFTVHAVLDARMGEVYAASYAWLRQTTGLSLEPLSEPALYPYDTHLGHLDCADVLLSNLDDKLQHAQLLAKTVRYAVPDAASVLGLAQLQLAQGQLPMDAAMLQPRYVRDQVALTQAQLGRA